MSETPAPQITPADGQRLPPENIPRGTILALVIVPAGIIVWTIIWSFGFIASIVALGVALGALALYRFGSGGRVSRNGAIRVTIITVITLALSFVAGLAWDGLPIWTQQHGQSAVEALTDPRFWSAISRAASHPDVLLSLGLAAVFGLLGCFSVLRTAFVQAAGGPTPPAAPVNYADVLPPDAARPGAAPAPAPAPDAAQPRLTVDEPDDPRTRPQA